MRKLHTVLPILVTVLFLLMPLFGWSQESVEKEPFGGNSFGLFVHYLPGGPSSEQAWQSFDIEKLAAQVAEVGADRLVFTIYQNSGWFNAPNDTYDHVVGWKPGERSSARDIPMELANALAKRHIRLFLYITGQVPNRDAAAQKAYNLSQGPNDQKIDLTFAKKWAEVYRTWSLRYGDKVSGWWVDGCYAWCDFNEDIAAVYKEALRAGNPKTVIAFNSGVKRPEWKTSDYSSGEINEPFTEKGAIVVQEAKKLGHQPQILTFLGDRWAKRNVRFTAEQWAQWIKESLNAGVEVTIDVGPALTGMSEPVGTISEEQMKALRIIRDAIK